MLRGIAFVVMMSVGLVAAVFNRFAALLVYWWFALFRPQEWVWFDITSLRLSLVLGVVLVVPAFLTGILPNLTHPLSVGSLLFLLTGLIAQPAAAAPLMGWQWLDFLSRLILVCLLTVTMLNTKRRYLTFVIVAGMSLGYYTAKAGVASLIAGGLKFDAGLAGAFIDNNGYAMAAVMIMPFLLAAGQNVPPQKPGSRWIRLGFYLSVPLSAITVISTFSRAGFLALVVAALAFAVLQKRRVLILLALVLLVAVALPFVPIPEGYFERIDTIRSYDEISETSAQGRLHFWQVAVDMARDHPLGIGLRNFEATYDRYDSSNGKYGQRRSVHSSHFQVLAENGFAGLAVWAAMFIVAFATALRVRRRSRAQALAPDDRWFLITMSNALMISMSAFLVGGAFIALALNDLTWLTFALVAALDRISRDMTAPALT